MRREKLHNASRAPKDGGVLSLARLKRSDDLSPRKFYGAI